MKRQCDKTEGINRTKTMRFHPFVFNGKEKDYESGFHYYGARYYWSEVMTEQGYTNVTEVESRANYLLL